MKSAQFKSLGGSSGETLLASVLAKASSTFGRVVTSPEVHVLFHWNDHSFFTYHQDGVGDWAFIVNLLNCTSSMHVAGATKPAEMSGPGSARFFPTKLFHRSDVAPRRCVEVLFFLNFGELLEVKDTDAVEPGEVAPEVGSNRNKASTSTAAMSVDLSSSGETPSEGAEPPATEAVVKAEKSEESSKPTKRSRR